ncbi:DUF413 domain-containing protein [Thalassomonas sp. RHCl1]|uniref:DUF413 domain-containing protein n=1 Tax=Thalassomonas sp. RHCl1 TaxID=2995320 RepID=UPI00248C378C|nr:DUF413 domain-containing protein [Thalassomonas sp. RHCl1]
MNTTEINQDSFKSNRKFYDDRNYPRGMSRSGDYTLAEVQLLEQYGVALSELSSGKRSPINEQEQHFVEVCEGKAEPEHKIEKTWLKYQNKVLTPKQFHTLFGKAKIASDSMASEAVDLDDE